MLGYNNPFNSSGCVLSLCQSGISFWSCIYVRIVSLTSANHCSPVDVVCDIEDRILRALNLCPVIQIQNVLDVCEICQVVFLFLCLYGFFAGCLYAFAMWFILLHLVFCFPYAGHPDLSLAWLSPQISIFAHNCYYYVIPFLLLCVELYCF